MKTVKLETMNILAKQLDAYDKYKGTRPTSSSGHTLLEFLRLIFEHNHVCKRKDRLQDDDIRELVVQEFHNKEYLNEKKNYVSVWRNMFNTGRLHHITPVKRNFVAFRVNLHLQFTKSTSPTKPLTIRQLNDEYAKQGFVVPAWLKKEVIDYEWE